MRNPSNTQNSRSTIRPVHLLAIIATLIAAFLVSPTVANAENSDAQETTFMMARVDGSDFVFDHVLPSEFGKMVTCQGPTYSAFASQGLCKVSKGEGPDANLDVYQTTIGWVGDSIDQGTVRYLLKNAFDGSWQRTLDPNAEGWTELTALLKTQGNPINGAPGETEVDLVVAAVPGGETVRLAASDYQLRIIKMRELSQETVPASGSGTAFGPRVTNTALIPKDLGSYREQMLAYSNAARRDPDFRKNNGSNVVLDLGTPTTTVEGTTFTIFHDNPDVPYFNDQKPDPALNNAAQFHAEYLASIGYSTHDGPKGYIDPETNKPIDMTWEYDRSVYFGGTRNVAEGAAKGLPGDEVPVGWISGDSHFKPFFNIGMNFPTVGYGAAKSSTTGRWFFVFLAGKDATKKAVPISKVELPEKNRVGAVGPAGGKGTTSIEAVSNDPNQDTPSSSPPSSSPPSSSPPSSADPTSDNTSEDELENKDEVSADPDTDTANPDSSSPAPAPDTEQEITLTLCSKYNFEGTCKSFTEDATVGSTGLAGFGSFKVDGGWVTFHGIQSGTNKPICSSSQGGDNTNSFRFYLVPTARFELTDSKTEGC